MYRIENRKKSKNSQFIKQNILAEKVLWFRDNVPSDTTVCSALQTEELILKYLARFDEELEQITIKHSVGVRKNRQHASREDIVNMTKKREAEEFNTCGIGINFIALYYINFINKLFYFLEIPDILHEKNMQVLVKWNGELRFLQNLKLQRISKKYLQQCKNKSVSNITKNDNVLSMDTN